MTKRGMFCCLSCILLCACSCSKPSEKSSEKRDYVTELPSESGVYDWLRNFSIKDYEACDENSSSGSFQFRDFYVTKEHNASLVSANIYEEVLNKSVDSVTWVSVEPTGEESVFNVVVTYRPYKSISDVSFDEKELKELSDMYVVDDCSLDEYREAISEYIVTEFEECFKLSEEEKTLEVKLKQGTEGELQVVLNPVDFIVPLIDAQGITEIVKVFEDGVFTEFQEYIGSYGM